MSLPVPNLDDRTYEDLMKEALSLIPVYNKEWTNYNPSDPGITFLELFAWLSEMVIYRINQVPDENYRRFLSLMGFELEAPGTGNISARGKEIVGDKTVFERELKKGDSITVSGQTRFINEVISDTSMIIDMAFESDIAAGAKFTYSSLGTGTISSSDKTVTGIDTNFISDINKGDSITSTGYIKIDGTIRMFKGQTRLVSAINSDYSLSIDSPFIPDLPMGTNFLHSQESIDSGIQRGLESLSKRYRAVTQDDFEFLALECMDTLQEGLRGRAICMNNRDLEFNKTNIKEPQLGHVSVIVIPGSDINPVYSKNGSPTDELKNKIKTYLDVRRMITTRVHVVGPDYRKVKLETWISLKENTVERTIEDKVKDSIIKYFAPFDKETGKGWPLGRNLYQSEVYHLVEGIIGVDHVVKIRIEESEIDFLEIKDYQLIQIDPYVNIQERGIK